ncbi:hypothetical protein P3W45_000753 [Vairimorpha bombi]|jgi:Ran-binding protein 1
MSELTNKVEENKIKSEMKEEESSKDEQVEEKAKDEQVEEKAKDEQVEEKAKDEQVEEKAKDEQVEEKAKDEQVNDNSKKGSSFLTSTITKKDGDLPLGSEDNELKSLQEKFIESNLKDAVLFKSKCKLYIYNKDKNKFDERGVGDIMINKEKDSEMTKVVMIRESIMRFGCNHYINPRYKLMKNNNVANGWMWVTTEDTVDDEENIKKKMYLVKFDENELSEKFKEEYEEGMKSNKKILDR